MNNRLSKINSGFARKTAVLILVLALMTAVTAASLVYIGTDDRIERITGTVSEVVTLPSARSGASPSDSTSVKLPFLGDMTMREGESGITGIGIANSAENEDYDMRLDISMLVEGTEITIASVDSIKPGHTVNGIELDSCPGPGSYSLTVRVTFTPHNGSEPVEMKFQKDLTVIGKHV